MKNLPKTLSIIVIAIGTLVLIGWIFDIPLLKSISPNYISMKISTAISFILTGLITYYLTDEKYTEIAAIAVPISAFIVLLLMLSFILSSTLGLPPYIQDLFIQETNSPATEFLGAPSISTALLFILTAITAIIATVNREYTKKLMKITGITLITISTIALLGYLINQPALYYTIHGISNPIAINTATLFLLLGIAQNEISKNLSK